MTPKSNGLAAAIGQLSREIEAAMDGNSYYLASNKLREMKDLLLLQVSPAGGPAIGLSTALQTVRAKLGEEVTDNRYYIAAHTLDVIAYIAERAEIAGRQPAIGAAAAAASQPATAAPPPAPAMIVKSFDDLARDAKARVDAVTAADRASGTSEPRASEPCMAHAPDMVPAQAPVAVPAAASAPSPAPTQISSSSAEASRAEHSREQRPSLLSGFIRSVFGGRKRA
jgi:hypothetical protein